MIVITVKVFVLNIYLYVHWEVSGREERKKRYSGRKLSGADFAPSTQTDRQPLKRHRPETAAVVRPYLSVWCRRTT